MRKRQKRPVIYGKRGLFILAYLRYARASVDLLCSHIFVSLLTRTLVLFCYIPVQNSVDTFINFVGISFGSRVDEEDIQPIATYDAASGCMRRIASVASASPWKNRAFARKKMAEVRREHTVFYITRGGHASMVGEEEEEEEEVDDACVKSGEEASLDHHPLHGAVRGMLKEQNKKALKRARKMEKQT